MFKKILVTYMSVGQYGSFLVKFRLQFLVLKDQLVSVKWPKCNVNSLCSAVTVSRVNCSGSQILGSSLNNSIVFSGSGLLLSR